jgi:hypothetical protein
MILRPAERALLRTIDDLREESDGNIRAEEAENVRWDYYYLPSYSYMRIRYMRTWMRWIPGDYSRKAFSLWRWALTASLLLGALATAVALVWSWRGAYDAGRNLYKVSAVLLLVSLAIVVLPFAAVAVWPALTAGWYALLFGPEGRGER